MDSKAAEEKMEFLVWSATNMMVTQFIQSGAVFVRPETIAGKIKELRPLIGESYQYLFDLKLSEAYEEIEAAAESHNN